MKKALFVPLKNKGDYQVLKDISLTPQERVWNMFDLMEALSYLRKEKPVEVKAEHGLTYITLKRRIDGKLSL